MKMMLIKDTEPSEDMAHIRISASRGRGGQSMTYLYDRSPKDDAAPVRVASSVNRDLDDLSFRGAHATRNFHQVIELGSSRFTNTITSVLKDNLVWIERFP